MSNSHTNLAAQQAAGLRALADMIEANPKLAENFNYALTHSGIRAHLRWGDRAAELGHIARIAKRHGATVSKDIDDQWHNLALNVGGIKVEVLARRNEVCERIVVGTREVVEEVPDPEAMAAVPTVKRKRTEEIVRWECRPLLAQDSDETRDGAA
ncbi:hypothetical protein GCM10012275_64670 [Longimycelium tulufanense]|uniref:Uncharacterized protein n=1 Tax=Longimycelium tulufanense TaxID=907463 RepID=A0A8J3CFB4_9PSEU|nr:hypothetical protein [Longimycelium tulufanense]GGM84975.1 hypothetical protein GCM10012275_64670 [Longimycelium tulufanense]